MSRLAALVALGAVLAGCGDNTVVSEPVPLIMPRLDYAMVQDGGWGVSLSMAAQAPAEMTRFLERAESEFGAPPGVFEIGFLEVVTSTGTVGAPDGFASFCTLVAARVESAEGHLQTIGTATEENMIPGERLQLVHDRYGRTKVDISHFFDDLRADAFELRVRGETVASPPMELSVNSRLEITWAAKP